MAFIAATDELLLPKLQNIVTEIRRGTMDAARRWKLDSDQLHDALYCVIYGGRAAIEEAWVQNHSQSLRKVWQLNRAPASTPAAVVEGVRIHSGDIVLSRAGLVKLFGPIQSALGFKRTIPKGMHADSALLADALVNNVFPVLRLAMNEQAADYRARRGFEPPYWSLLKMAGQILEHKKKDLFPYLRMTLP